ncbi:MAG: hypothetical protein Q9159_003572 [Coniocarpon cinnabarinum]
MNDEEEEEDEMANKECTIFIVDVGESTGQKRHGRDQSDLDWSMQYVWDKLAGIISTGRKTLYTSVIGLRTNGTDHNGPTEEDYENISVFKYPSQMLLPDVRNLIKQLTPSDTDDGDAISAIIIAIQLIAEQCKQLKYKKQIIMTTNCTGTVEADQLGDIAQKLQDDGIELTVLGTDLDDAEFGFKEEDKDDLKDANEQTLKRLVDQCGGVIGTLKQAIEEIQVPRIYVPNSASTFKGQLTLSDYATFGVAMEIDVERFPKIMVKAASTAKRLAIKTEGNGDSMKDFTDLPDEEEREGVEKSLMRGSTTYQVKDPNALDGTRDVERKDLNKGYEYGRELVAIDPADEHVNMMETVSGMSIIGFVPRESLARFMNMSKANVIIAMRTNDLAAMALSSLIHTLYELDTCAVARLVTKNDRPPIVVALTPWIEPDFECLVDVELPFAEDFRQHKFPPLDRIPTLSGKVITEHRNIPSEELKHAMAAYVDGMDISKADRDEDGQETEYLKLEDNFSPKVNRINQAIKHRAIHPDNPVPPPLDILTKFSHPPEHILKQTQKHLDKLIEAANVKKVPPKSMSRRNFRGKKDQEAPRSGLDVTALLGERSAANQRRISPQNAIPEFKQMMDGAEDIETVRDGVKQFGDIIRQWITQSMGDSNYGRVLEGIGLMRRECIELEEAGTFNDLMRDLKQELFEEKLGGDRRELWWQLRISKLSLIEKGAAPEGGVEEDEARQFLIPDRTRS